MSNQQPGEPGFGNFAAQLPNAEKVVHPESITGVRDQGSGLSFPRHASAVESQEKRKGEARKAPAPAMFSIPYSLFPIPNSLFPASLFPASSHRRPNRLLLLRVQLRVGRVLVRLPVHPLIQPRALEAPPVAQLERRHKTLRRVLVERIRRNAQVVRGLANI